MNISPRKEVDRVTHQVPGLAKKPGWFWRRTAAIAGPVLSSVGAALFSLSVTEGLFDWMEWVNHPFWVGASFLAIPAGVAWTVGAESKRATYSESLAGARRAAVVQFTGTLSPLVHDLGKLAAYQSTNFGRDLVNRCVSAIPKMIDVPEVRACMYNLDQVESAEADAEDIPNALYLRTPHEGRSDRPRNSFVRDESEVANQLFAVLDTGKPRVVPDVRKSDQALDCDGKKYKTFINVPVKFQTEELGLLSVDAPEPNSLTESHVVVAEMVADLIGMGIYRERRNQRGRKPPQPTDNDSNSNAGE